MLPCSSTSIRNFSFLSGSALMNNLCVNLADSPGDSIDLSLSLRRVLERVVSMYRLPFDSVSTLLLLVFSIPFSGKCSSSLSESLPFPGLGVSSSLLRRWFRLVLCTWSNVCVLVLCTHSKDLKCFSKSGVPLREKSRAFLFTPETTCLLELSEFMMS